MDALRHLGFVTLAASIAPLLATAPHTPAHARPRLIAAHTALVAGETAELALTFDIDPTWHLYWEGLNDTGFAPQIKLALPKGYEALPARWPAPTRHVADGDIVDHIYENTATIILPVKVPADAATPAKFTADIKWLVCSDVCVPESASVELTLPVQPKGPAAAGPDSKRIDAARARLPRPLAAAAGRVTAKHAAGRLVIEAASGTALAFFPHEGSAPMSRLAAQGQAAGPRLEIETTGTPRVSGVVHVTPASGGTPEYYLIDLPAAK